MQQRPSSEVSSIPRGIAASYLLSVRILTCLFPILLEPSPDSFFHDVLWVSETGNGKILMIVK